MNSLKAMKNCIYGLLGYIMITISKLLLTLIDFASLVACLWTTLWLVYLHFLKDLLDIIVYATLKYANRIAWLCRISKANALLKLFSDFLRTDNILLSQTLNVEQDEIFETSPAIIEVTSYETKKTVHFPRSSTETSTPHSSICTMINPRKINLKMEDQHKRDVAYVSPVQQSSFRQIFSWNFGRNRRSSSYRTKNYSISSSEFARAKDAIAAIRTPSIMVDDQEHLIVDDSPERIGCCTNFFSFLKVRFQDNQSSPPSMHYQRF